MTDCLQCIQITQERRYPIRRIVNENKGAEGNEKKGVKDHL